MPAALDSRQYQTIVAGSLIVAVSYGWGRYNYGLFLPHIGADFRLDTVGQGLIASASYSGYLVTTLFASLFAARLGPRLMVTVGGLLASGGLLLVAVADSLFLLTCGFVIAGISPGLCYIPLSEVSVRRFTSKRRSTAYALMNAGTSFGVVAAGPVVIWYGEQWRGAWVAFAVCALAITLWNGWVMPGRMRHPAPEEAGPSKDATPRLEPRGRWPIYAFSFMIGVACSTYWTYAVATLAGIPGFGTPQQAVFWIILGMAGIAGGGAGHMVHRLGFNASLTVLTVVLCASHILIYLEPDYAWALVSSAMFGGGFIALTALAGIWAVESSPDSPARTFGLAFLVMSVGQFVAPAAMGIVASVTGLPALFAIACVLLLGLNLLRPGRDFRPQA